MRTASDTDVSVVLDNRQFMVVLRPAVALGAARVRINKALNEALYLSAYSTTAV